MKNITAQHTRPSEIKMLTTIYKGLNKHDFDKCPPRMETLDSQPSTLFEDHFVSHSIFLNSYQWSSCLQSELSST